MAAPTQNTDRLYRIAERHCLKYGPSLEATGQAYGTPQRIILQPGSAEEKVFTRFYVCPLCFKNVLLAIGNQLYYTEEFDPDHFPAASICGRKTLLVCKACNSRYGSELDYSGKEHHNYHGFLKNRASMTAKLKLGGLVDNYTVELVRNDDTSFTFTDHHRNSYLMQQFLKIGIDKVVNKMPFQVAIRQRIPPAAIFEKSLLKAAYLYFFSVMGYDFAFSYVGTRIRRVLDGDEPHPLANHGVLTNLEDSPLEEGIYMMVEPRELRSFFVLLETKFPEVGVSQKHMVLIPSFADGSWENLKAFEPVIGRREGEFTQVKMTQTAISQLPVLPYRVLTQMFLSSKELEAGLEV